MAAEACAACAAFGVENALSVKRTRLARLARTRACTCGSSRITHPKVPHNFLRAVWRERERACVHAVLHDQVTIQHVTGRKVIFSKQALRTDKVTEWDELVASACTAHGNVLRRDSTKYGAASARAVSGSVQSFGSRWRSRAHKPLGICVAGTGTLCGMHSTPTHNDRSCALGMQPAQPPLHEEPLLYGVPDAVTFRNVSVIKGPQVRNLLLKNNTAAPVQAVVSYPFTPFFALALPAAEAGQALRPNPPHAVLTVPPQGTSKVCGRQARLEAGRHACRLAAGSQHVHVHASCARVFRGKQQAPDRRSLLAVASHCAGAIGGGGAEAAGSWPACCGGRRQLPG